MIDLSSADRERLLLDLDRADCEDSLYTFLQYSWRYVDPSPFQPGWVLEAICEHLEAVVDGDIRRLIINIPPRCGKSTITSVCFPAWVWAQRYDSPTSGPSVPLLHASYAMNLALRDSVKCRRLIESPFYQRMWGERFQLVGDQNTKGRFANTAKGERLITAVEAKVTGEGGNIIVLDDPNAANEVLSAATIETTKEWWDGTMSTRLNDIKSGAFVIIQQRLAEEDLTGHILATDHGFTHLCLPMEYEWQRHSVSGIGWEDPRGLDAEGDPLVVVGDGGVRLPRDAAARVELDRREGTLLWPARFGKADVDDLARRLGPWKAAGQLQQRPEPKGGGIIKTEWWQPYDQASYPPMDLIVASLDTAYTEKTSNDPSAMTVWGVFSGADSGELANRYVNREGRITENSAEMEDFNERLSRRAMAGGDQPKVILMHAWTERLELHELVEKVAQSCRKMKVDKLLIENKAAGHSVQQELRRLYGHESWAIELDDPKGQDKVARLYSVQHLFAEGMIYAPNKSWADLVIDQCRVFPKGKHDDLVDTLSAALRHLRKIGALQRAQEWAADVRSEMSAPQKLAPLYNV